MNYYNVPSINNWNRCIAKCYIKIYIMTKQEVYEEIKGLFGLVPTFFKLIPENTLEFEWTLMRKIVAEETLIPNKYKELMGVAISAATKCQYCIFFHTQMAILFGASPEEIEEAVHYSKNSAGWSAYLNGMQLDFNEFKKEVTQMCEYVKEAHAA